MEHRASTVKRDWDAGSPSHECSTRSKLGERGTRAMAVGSSRAAADSATQQVSRLSLREHRLRAGDARRSKLPNSCTHLKTRLRLQNAAASGASWLAAPPAAAAARAV